MPSKPVAFAKPPGPNLTVHVSELSGVGIVRCVGDICSQEDAVQLSQGVEPFLIRLKDVVLELTEVDAVGGACITELVVLSMKARAAGRVVALVAPSETVFDRLIQANVASLFQVSPSAEQAITSLSSERANCLI
jgi:anti-anti-sigma regulatory factor